MLQIPVPKILINANKMRVERRKAIRNEIVKIAREDTKMVGKFLQKVADADVSSSNENSVESFKQD